METINYYRDKKGNLMALLVKADHQSSGIEFLTDDNAYMQVASMGHPKGHIIKPHYHNKVIRTIELTCETLVIRKGILAVDLYENQEICHSFEIGPGDVLSLFSGGHGFRVVEDVDMIEIKQGPFLGAIDKTRF